MKRTAKYTVPGFLAAYFTRNGDASKTKNDEKI
jgi:hypothetical protein